MQPEIQNLMYATGAQSVDELNAEFYGKIRYPWPPQYFERIKRTDLSAKMLAHDIGQWDSRILPDGARIWVAGCGTNQALFTALRFPRARVLGSDLSTESLATCTRNAASLGVSNLELRQESINQANYSDCFDYVICTGVIHHNSDPVAALSQLARALKPTGLLELMVYNQFHRILSSAFQNAVRALLGNPSKPDLASELPVAHKLVASLHGQNLMSAFLETVADTPDAAFADLLLQPVEYSYTVASLAEASRRCNLELLTSSNDSFSRAQGDADWNLLFNDAYLDRLYSALGDVERWHIANLLLAESSPMLWFYLQRHDCPRRRKPERDICDEFFGRRFARVRTEREIFIRQEDGSYSGTPQVVPYPGEPRHPIAKRILAELDEGAPFGETLRRLGLDPSFPQKNRLRLNLATSGCPFLEAV